MISVKALITTAADENFDFLIIFSEKTKLDISCKLPVKWTIHMKCLNLFSSEKLKKKFFF